MKKILLLVFCFFVFAQEGLGCEAWRERLLVQITFGGRLGGYVIDHNQIIGSRFLQQLAIKGDGVNVILYEEDIELNHPHLQGKITIKSQLPKGDIEHGTHVGGLIASTNPYIGTASGASLTLDAKFKASDYNKPTKEGNIINVSQILSNSFSNANINTKKNAHLDRKFELSSIPGENSIISCGLGNDFDTLGNFLYTKESIKFSTSYEANGKILLMGALQYDFNTGLESIADFSQRQAESMHNTPILFAPGDKIFSCAPMNRVKTLSGTSMATPLGTGGLALLKGYFPEWKGNSVLYIDLLLASARKERMMTWRIGEKFFDSKFGYGALDILMAFELALLVTEQSPEHIEMRSKIIQSLQCRQQNFITYRSFYGVKHIRRWNFDQKHADNFEILKTLYGSGASWDQETLDQWLEEREVESLRHFVNRLDIRLKHADVRIEALTPKYKKKKGADNPFARNLFRALHKDQKKKAAAEEKKREFYQDLRDRAAGLLKKKLFSDQEKRESGLIFYYEKVGGGQTYEARDMVFKEERTHLVNVALRQRLHRTLSKIAEPEKDYDADPYIKLHQVDFEEYENLVKMFCSTSFYLEKKYFDLKELYPGASPSTLEFFLSLMEEENLETSEKVWNRVGETVRACHKAFEDDFDNARH